MPFLYPFLLRPNTLHLHYVRFIRWALPSYMHRSHTPIYPALPFHIEAAFRSLPYRCPNRTD